MSIIPRIIFRIHVSTEAFNTNEHLEKSLGLEVSTIKHFLKVRQIYVRVYLATIVSSLETMVYVEIGCSLATIELCNRRKDSMFFLKT